MNQCPCGLPTDYLACCGSYLEKQEIAKTPEALMRSRYTAYSQARVDYLRKTMLGKPLVGFNDQETALWAKRVKWLGLQVITSYLDPKDENTGFVEFIARYMEKNSVKTIHELSQFQRHNSSWFYTDSLPPKTGKSTLKQKISRNEPCPCGSQKKYKNCHAIAKD
ncbi:MULTISPECIES: YchJ family protein [unclassified Legionella]|uniref:YchJ family protein n=1 Tax=unclassified Legionella TaxID=2622702 RepID=UPI001E4BB94B|nr:YchJ family metal-binding protein [Legionella sp. 31fI33]MCC5013945.1 SEC-C domain-containing protein [Legionella sp. 31fI33]